MMLLSCSIIGSFVMAGRMLLWRGPRPGRSFVGLVHGSLAVALAVLWASGGGRRYISYDALRGDAVPCSRPGVPYYNCRVSTTANPYSRGCESITRCRDDDPS